MYDHSYLLAMSDRGLENLPELRQLAPSNGENKQLRTFSIWEICQFMLKIPPDTLRKKLVDDPTLPQGEVAPDARQRWFTLTEVNELRRRIKYRGRLLLPARPKAPAIRTAMANFKSGAGKTTIAQHFAHSAALDGYRVLIIDFDPTAALTHAMGVSNIQESHTVWGLLCRDIDQQTSAELPSNIRSIGALRAQDFIHKTCWPTIDIIPSSARSAFAELALTDLRALDPEWQYYAAVDQYLKTLPEDQYDVILLDCPPSIDQKTLNAFFAADILYVPTGPTYQEFESTSAFLRQISQATANLDADFQAIRLLLTKLDREDIRHSNMQTVYQDSYGADFAAAPIEFAGLLEHPEYARNSIYEMDYRQMTREEWKSARSSFDLAYAEFKSLLGLA